jgi:hypothetical protein
LQQLRKRKQKKKRRSGSRLGHGQAPVPQKVTKKKQPPLDPKPFSEAKNPNVAHESKTALVFHCLFCHVLTSCKTCWYDCWFRCLPVGPLGADGVRIHWQAALAYRDPFGKQALDYADEGDRAFRAKSFTQPDFDPDTAHRCVMTELLIAAVDRLKVRLDVTKQDERNEVRHPCGLGCGWKGPFVWKFSHEWLDCVNREMKCPKQCGAVMRFRDLAVRLQYPVISASGVCVCVFDDPETGRFIQEHELKHCPHREVPCKRAHLGCDVILPVYQLGLHEEKGCRYRGITCPLGCGREFRQDEKNRHLVRFTRLHALSLLLST